MAATIGILATLYSCVLGGMYTLQRKLLYQPGATPAYTKEQGLSDMEIVRLTTSDSHRVIAWHLRRRADFPTIIYFHGNAGTLFDRADKFRTLGEEGFNVIALSYRGFSGNEGSPTEQGLYEDARAVIAYARSIGITDDHMIFYGESLGTGVAVQMATETTPALLVLEAPYTSVVNRAAEVYPYIPVRLLMKDKFDSLSKIATVKAPLLVLHGDADKTIPIAHGRKLLETAQAPKKGVFFHGKGHVDFDLAVLAHEVKQFAQEQKIIPPLAPLPTFLNPN